MSLSLLVDFGASRVKSVLWSHDRQTLAAANECPAPEMYFGPLGEVEAPGEAYWKALEATAGELLIQNPQVDNLWLCCEMHGFVFTPLEEDPSKSTYISWRDERASRRPTSGASIYTEMLQPQAAAFFRESGMELRPGLPLVTLAHLLRRGFSLTHQRPHRLFTLADFLLWRGGEKDPAIHASLAAGTGLFNPYSQCWSAQLLALAGLQRDQVYLPRVVPTSMPLGQIQLAGRKITVHGGLGDLQAAVHGAQFPKMAQLIVNLGTGSQVLRAGPSLDPRIERRPGANGDLFGAITHIPSGRALNVFAEFLDGCASAGGGSPFFWERFGALETAEVLAAPPNVDLNVFKAAWRYNHGGLIGNIHEGKFSIDTLMPALAKSWLEQYSAAFLKIDPQRILSSFLLAGGLSRRAPFIRPVLEQLSGRIGILSKNRCGEETLDGLLLLAEERLNGT